jgi:predicted ATPase
VVAGDREVFRTAASSHVKAVRGVASLEGGEGHALHVAGGAGAFQAVDQDDFALGFAIRALGVHQDLDFRLSAVKRRFDGPPLVHFRARPKVSGEGRQVGVAEERLEGAQIKIVRCRGVKSWQMLTRVSIDNFRCFEKFEYRPARRQLILGGNGSGKSTLMDALWYVRSLATLGLTADQIFTSRTRTRWSSQTRQTFEIEAALDENKFVYQLVIETAGKPLRPLVKVESIHCNGELIFKFEDGFVRSDSTAGITYPLDQSRSGLPTIGAGWVSAPLFQFREWLGSTSNFSIDPFAMGTRADRVDPFPNPGLTNFASWYRHLVQTYPQQNTLLQEALRDTFEDFVQLKLETLPGEDTQLLTAEFCSKGTGVRVEFHELSHGQRCLIGLYAILYFVVAKGGTVIIDEPENFISLREVQPWLMAADDMVDDYKGQVLLISHHPELINQWAPSYGVRFVRDGIGPVRVTEFRCDPESPLSASELVARGWELE